MDPVLPSSSADPLTEPYRCSFRTHSSQLLVLHKADRHLIYPEGGIEELKRLDPMLIAERREQQRRMRQDQRHRPHSLPTRPGSSARDFQLPAKQSNGEVDRASDRAEDNDTESDVSDASEDDGFSEDRDETHRPEAGQRRANERMFDGPPDATISGLNIQLDSPELIAEWINQRKKRWPTQEVVQHKLKEREERQRRSEMIYGPRPTAYGKRPREEAGLAPSSPAATPSSSAVLIASSQEKKPKVETTGRNAVADVEAFRATPDGAASVQTVQIATSEESDSDDGAPEEASSKAPVPPLQEEQSSLPLSTPASDASRDTRQDLRPICTHFLQGRCNYGDRCRKRHDTAPSSSSMNSSGQQQQRQSTNSTRRPHPRPPPVNPFDQPDLLRQLLRNEIEKHVDAVGQAIRFIVDNDMLLHVETEEGQAEEQRKRRQKIQVMASIDDAAGAGEGGTKVEADDRGVRTPSGLPQEPLLSEPVMQGGMAVVKAASGSSDPSTAGRASVYRPASPTLRALSELKYPPEPDPLIYLDPLRRDDPKPLLPSQLVRIAKDAAIRSILSPSTPIHPHGHTPAALERAIVSLDALPTDLYRNAAIEMILGIASSSPGQHHNPAGGLVVTSKDGRKKVSETDLFRMGLRVGSDEVLAIKKLADRLSVLLDSSLQLDEVGEADWALLTREQRDEMRQLHYTREAERLAKLRKLGIDV